MTEQSFMDRRGFMRTLAGAAAGGLGSVCGCSASIQEIDEAVAKVGWLPRRQLGSTGMEVSVLVGASTWGSDAVEAGIRCGVNFWHGAYDWEPDEIPQGILKNREAHYCQVGVNRVRGNHETGVIDEEAHYRSVKQALQVTGLRYFDDLQFHMGYHSVAELKANRGLVRAFERLKKEGVVRHLSISQHSYNGNRRVPGGQSDFEILTAVVEDGVYEHAQFFYSYGDSPAAEEFVSLAKRKGFGTIAMKTTRGAARMARDAGFMKTFPAGTTPHQALARWLTTRTQLDAAVIEIRNLRQFVDSYSGAGKNFRAVDATAIREMTAYADREVCRLCSECMGHCEHGIPIAEILRFERYARDYGERRLAQRLYANLDTRADACVACEECMRHCAQGLRIPEKLAQAHSILA